MKIGFFDSGIGGLTIYHDVLKILPDYDYLYLGDNAHSPYGNRSQEEIYKFTQQGVKWLFGQGAAIVILACNTASSQALRRLQREWLAEAGTVPARRILGIIIPIAQDVALRSQGKIGIIGTKATIESKAYIKELRKIRPKLSIIQVAAPEVAPLIEKNASREELKAVLEMYLAPFSDAQVDTLILACTHYPLIYPLFQDIVGESIYIPHTGEIVAKKLQTYLNHHPEINHFLLKAESFEKWFVSPPPSSAAADEGGSKIETKLSKNATQEFFTTGLPALFAELSQRFIGHSIIAKQVSL